MGNTVSRALIRHAVIPKAVPSAFGSTNDGRVEEGTGIDCAID